MIEQRRTLNGLGQTLKSQVTILGAFVIFIWLLEIVDLVILGNRLNGLGVRPRSFAGLFGIFLMPFLHNGLSHVLANTIPFVVMGWLVMLRRTADFFFVSFIVILVSGFGVWLLGGTNTVHIGASGLVFGYFGFLVVRSYFERSFFSILVTIVVIFIYGGLIWGVLPAVQSGISWMGHLFGFVGGAYAAYLVTTKVSRSYHSGRIL